MDAMNKIKDMVCVELEEFAKKGKLTAQDLDAIHKLVITKEKLLRTEQIENEMGYSQDGGWMARGAYSRSAYPMSMDYSMRGNSYGNNSYDMMDPYEHSMRGRRYSMDDGRSMMGDRLTSMMDDPSLTQQERAALKKAMDSMR